MGWGCDIFPCSNDHWGNTLGHPWEHRAAVSASVRCVVPSSQHGPWGEISTAIMQVLATNGTVNSKNNSSFFRQHDCHCNDCHWNDSHWYDFPGWQVSILSWNFSERGCSEQVKHISQLVGFNGVAQYHFKWWNVAPVILSIMDFIDVPTLLWEETGFPQEARSGPRAEPGPWCGWPSEVEGVTWGRSPTGSVNSCLPPDTPHKWLN